MLTTFPTTTLFGSVVLFFFQTESVSSERKGLTVWILESLLSGERGMTVAAISGCEKEVLASAGNFLFEAPGSVRPSSRNTLMIGGMLNVDFSCFVYGTKTH